MKMFKKVFFSFLLSFFVFFSFAQGVGVNINNQNTNFAYYIDAAGDNASTPNSTQTANDVVITTAGKVGIGLNTPTQQLHIKTDKYALRLADGRQKADYVLYSDYQGSGIWQPYGPYQAVQAVLPSANQNFTIVAGALNQYLNMYIKLPPGIWMIDTQMLVYSVTNSFTQVQKRLFLSFYLTDSTTATTPTNDCIAGTSKFISGFAYQLGYGYNMIPGNFLVKNTTNTIKTYYMKLQISGNWSVANGSQFAVGGQGTEAFCTAIFLGTTYKQ